MKKNAAKRKQLHFLFNAILQFLVILFFYEFFIVLGLFYNGLGLSRESFEFILLISKNIHWYIPPSIFVVFTLILKIKINFLTLIINSFLVVIIGLLILDLIAYPNLILGLVIIILLAIIFRLKVKKILKLNK